MLDLLLRAPGLFRTLSSVLVVAAGVADQVAPLLTGELKGAALVTAIVGLLRAALRKTT